MTKIFKSYDDFKAREDKSINGVSQAFYDKYGYGYNDNCKGCFNCTKSYDCKGCIGCNDCEDCTNCTNCDDCNDCTNSKGCTNCNNCEDCTNRTDY